MEFILYNSNVVCLHPRVVVDVFSTELSVSMNVNFVGCKLKACGNSGFF